MNKVLDVIKYALNSYIKIVLIGVRFSNGSDITVTVMSLQQMIGSVDNGQERTRR